MAREKCAEWGCSEDAKWEIAKRGLYFCSGSCAALHLNAPAKLTPLGQTEKSSLEGPTEALVPISTLAPMTTDAKNIINQPNVNVKGDDMQATQISTGQKNVQDGGQSSKEFESGTAKDMAVITQQQNSTHSLLNSDMGELESTNLLDESIRSTYSLSKNVMEKVKKNNVVDPQSINAVCNVVKQFSSLLKLKLDIHKAMSPKK